MKKCPICNRSYSDNTLSFCLEDGSLLSPEYDAEETLIRAERPTFAADNRESIRNADAKRPTRNVLPTYLVVGFFALFLGGGIVALLLYQTGDSANLRARQNNSDSRNSEPSLKSTPAANSPLTKAIDSINGEDVKPPRSNTSSRPTSMEYGTYSNPRFGYSVKYPKDLEPQTIAANGDGRKFVSGDGQIEMMVYGTENVSGVSLADRYREELGQVGRSITYKVLKPSMFVISGYKDGNIYYQKTMMKKNQLITFHLSYPPNRRKPYDEITANISKSFR